MDDNNIKKILRKCLLIKSRQNKSLKLFYLFKWNKNILDSKLYFINKSRNLKLNLNKINIYDKLYNQFKFRDTYISAMKIYNQLKEDSIYSFKPNINNNYYINTDNRSLNKSISYCSFKVSNSTKNIKKTDKNIINQYNYKNNHSNYSTNNNIYINKKNKSNTKNNNKYFIDFVNNNLITNNNTKENLMKMLYSNYKNKNIFRKKSKPKIIKNKSISNYNEDSFNVYNNNFIDLNEKSSIKSNNNSFNKMNNLNKEKSGFLSNRFKNKSQNNNISISTSIDPYRYIHNKNIINNNDNLNNNNNNLFLSNKNYQKNSKLIKKIKKDKKNKHSQNSINSNNDNNNSSFNINNTASLTNPNLFNSNNTNINNNNNNNVNQHNTSSTFNNTNANIKNNLLIYEKGELNNNNSLNNSKNKKIINKSQTLQIDTLTSNDDELYSKKHSFNNSIHNKYNNNYIQNNKKLILTKNSLYLNANYPQISNINLQSKTDEKMFMEAKNILSSDHSLQRYLEGYYKYKDKKYNNKI